jgi:nitrous oxidase accessory protein NosD
MPRNPRLGLAIVAAALAAAAAGAPPAAAASACDQVATPGPGAAQRLVDSLAPGQTGCLRGGLYEGNVKVSRPGVTLTRYAAEKPIVKGRFWVAEGADGVTVQGLHLDGTNPSILPSPTINADGVTFRRNDVTNNHTAICFSLGHEEWGRPERTTIEFNRIHDCGRLPATNHDHGIYVNASTGAVIRGNWIYDNADRGIQLYPDAQNSTIVGNVIDGNGQGIIFSGEGGLASSGNLVEGNVIANSKLRNNVESWYPHGNPVGQNNVVRNNCVKGGAYDEGDGGIGDQVGFKVYSAVRSRPAFSNRSSKDFRLVAGTSCRNLLAYRNTTPGPDGLRNARATRALRKRPVVLATASRQLRHGARLHLLGGVPSDKARPGLRVTIFASSRGQRRRLGGARLDSQGRFSVRPRVRVSRAARFVRLSAVVRGVGHSRSIRVRLRGR